MVCQFKSHDRMVSYKTVTHSIHFSPGCISCRFRHTKHNGKKKMYKIAFLLQKNIIFFFRCCIHRVCVYCMECNKIVPDRRGENNHGISRSLLLSQLYCFVCVSQFYDIQRFTEEKNNKKDFFPMNLP